MSRFEFNREWPDNFEAESEELKGVLERKGEHVLERARAYAAPHSKTGTFLNSLHGELMRAARGAPFYRVYTDDPDGPEKEFGTDDTEGIRALGRAIGENLEGL